MKKEKEERNMTVGHFDTMLLQLEKEKEANNKSIDSNKF
jgi:hypothetical protein